MDALTALMTRRSTRQFADKPVTAEQLETLLRAAMAAPSAGNQQPWRFVVVRDEATRARLAVATPYSSPVGRAPVGIVVLADTRHNKHPGYWVQDCSAAVENLLLAAHAIGLGGVWIGVHPTEDREAAVREIVEAPEGFAALCMIAIGHPAHSGPEVDRYRAEWVRDERWGA
ncbi:MAG TPA: nitroreductase family protein [Coriobacteriia bacterium]